MRRLSARAIGARPALKSKKCCGVPPGEVGVLRRSNLGVYAFDEKFFRNLFVQLCVQPADALENESLEIKGWCHNEKELTEKVVDAASCLANAQGGVVLVGVGEESTAQKF